MKQKQREETAELLRALASGFESLAQALDEDDGILGALAGQNLAMNLPALPAHIRETLIENLTDEAARGHRADMAYFEAQS